MFSDAFCLTQAVLNGSKTMTRRVLRDNVPLGNWEETAKHLPYKVGEVVAIAQPYKDIANERDEAEKALDLYKIGDNFLTMDEMGAGWNNKMFVKADLMPHHIRITDVKVESLQDISDDDIMQEGIRKESFAGGCMFCYNKAYIRNGNRRIEPIYNSTPRRAFASLMYKIIGGRTWASNPWVVAYSFELVD